MTPGSTYHASQLGSFSSVVVVLMVWGVERKESVLPAAAAIVCKHGVDSLHNNAELPRGSIVPRTEIENCATAKDRHRVVLGAVAVMERRSKEGKSVVAKTRRIRPKLIHEPSPTIMR
jgi:hypothetical protein